jgi:phosphoesterase RecJ-like protein
MNETTARTNQNKNNPAFEEAKEFFSEHSRFLLASHAGTDGDDLGTIMALREYLNLQGKKTIPLAEGGVPPSLQFFPDHSIVISSLNGLDIEKDFDALILSGCNRPGRTGFPEIENTKLPILNIDHHPDNQRFGLINLVDPQKSSVAELTFELLKYLDAPINEKIAKYLLTGMFTDTGSFMHSNTQASTLAAAAELMRFGARVDKIYNFAYKGKDPQDMKAWARAIENTRVDEKNKVAISIFTTEDLEEIGGKINADTFNGFVETLNKIPGTRFAMFIRQEGYIIKGSVRSEERKNVDVSKIAKVFGGGGHKLAAGFSIEGKIIRLPDGSWKVENKD